MASSLDQVANVDCSNTEQLTACKANVSAELTYLKNIEPHFSQNTSSQAVNRDEGTIRADYQAIQNADQGIASATTSNIADQYSHQSAAFQTYSTDLSALSSDAFSDLPQPGQGSPWVLVVVIIVGIVGLAVVFVIGIGNFLLRHCEQIEGQPARLF